MQNYSTTQASNIAVLAGALAMVLSRFHIAVTSDELQLLLGALIIIGGVAVNWYQRWKRGDVTPLGYRK